MSESTSLSASSTVLDDVRRALGRNKTEAPQPLEPFIPASTDQADVTRVERFMSEAEALGCSVHRVGTAGEILDRIRKICAEGVIQNVVMSDSRVLSELDLAPQLSESLIVSEVRKFRGRAKEELIDHLANCSVGITGVESAIAETGTIVLSSDDEQSLLVSLLPPIHIAVLESSQVKDNLTTVIEDLNTAQMGRDNPCRSATFISGPSRTSDVELTLSIGVHGPKELHLIIWEF